MTAVLTGAGRADGDGPSLKIRKPAGSRAEYAEAIRRTASMVDNPAAQQLASQYGLNILNLTWEDPGRFKGSSVGPNISDMTIQVGLENPQTRQFAITCMPVIRYPNFSDRTCDIDPEDFTILVGNQADWGGIGGGYAGLQRVSLYDFLRDPLPYLTHPGSWRGSHKSLWASRDSKVLVSAQACFLPVPKEGLATFNPVIFNYQSVSGDPAVLTVLATREGTSTTVIDNKRDAFAAGIAWGQRLFHNQHGMRASLTGQRQSDYHGGNVDSGNREDEIKGSNMVLLIQIPLRQHNPMRFDDMKEAAPSGSFGGAGGAMARRGGSDVENAVIGHGQIEGPFTEIDNLNIERDPRYPIRVTVQFYKATSNGIVSAEDMRQIHDEIEQVYAQSDSVGSLVTEGETGRATEYYGMKVQPADWWQEFWQRNEENTGLSPAEAMANLRKLLGRVYTARPVSDLYLRDLLRRRAR